MRTNRNQVARESREALSQSGTSYKTPDLSSDDFVPNEPFKAIHVNDVAGGDITIVGLDGIAATFTVSQGSWPYGGLSIVQATTTVTDLVAIF
jgi:hypothetical protein